jgi:hypothetical protein
MHLGLSFLVHTTYLIFNENGKLSYYLPKRATGIRGFTIWRMLMTALSILFQNVSFAYDRATQPLFHGPGADQNRRNVRSQTARQGQT